VTPQVLGWRERQAVRAYRTWHGYIVRGSVDSWDVRLPEQPDGVSGRVVREVPGKDATPDGNLANSMRITVKRDAMLARAPTPEECAFLADLARERGYGKGFPVRLRPR
jgi:hypothetical protein